MNRPRSSARRWKTFAGLAVFAMAVAGMRGAEPDIGGDYDDEGTPIATARGESRAPASLHALLCLEFDPRQARALHDRTARVAINHSTGLLEVQVFDTDGNVSWQSTWRRGEGYTVQGDRVLVRFPAARPGGDETVLIFEPVTAHRLLQVEVQRLTPTLLGPIAHPVGTFVFHRLE